MLSTRFFITPKSNESLYLSSVRALELPNRPDAMSWCAIANLLNSNVCIFDRTEFLKMPFRIKKAPHSFLPTDISVFTKSYEQICQERAEEILQIQNKLGKKIALLYSGGIDSTLVAIAFMKALKPKEFKDRIVVFLNQDSVLENPTFYYDHLRKVSKFESSEKIRGVLNGDYLVVGAEFNDQLHGSDLLFDAIKRDGESILQKKVTPDYIRRMFLSAQMSLHDSEIWTSLILEQIKNQKLVDIQTVSQFYWWFNFIFKWQAVYFRILLRILPENRSLMSEDYLHNHYQHFFSSSDFQKWAMVNSDLKIKNTWASYKWHAKDLIFDFNKDANYRDNKIKTGSLWNLFQVANTPVALTSEYRYLNQIQPESFYQPLNSFADAIASI